MVRMSELFPSSPVFIVDTDFGLYRKHGRQAMTPSWYSVARCRFVRILIVKLALPMSAILTEGQMTTHEATISKVQQLPEPLVQEVSDFIDFLLVKQNTTHWQLWTHFRESIGISDTDFSDYLANLEKYEDQLVRGEVRW